MIGLDKSMPSKLKKRRVVYVDDSSWSRVEECAFIENRSISEALREILRRG